MPLDHIARDKGRRQYRRFFTLNAFSVAVLMDSVLVLYGIKNGLTDSALAALVSFSYLTMPFLLLGKPLIARWGLTRAWSNMWILRYLSMAAVLAAPLSGSHSGRTVIILAGAFGFSAFRSMGLINNQPILGSITDNESRGRYLSGNQINFNVVYGPSLVVVAMVTRVWESVITYQILIATGVSVGLVTARTIRTIPESASGKIMAARPLAASVRLIWRDRRIRRLVFGWAAGFTSFSLFVPFILVAIKNGYGISDSRAFLYVIVSVVGSVSSSFMNQEVSDRLGPRPLFIAYTATLVGLSVFWAYVPVRFLPVLIAASFFLAGFAKTGIIVAAQHYMLSVADDDARLPLSMLVEVVGGLAAGLAGTVFAGGMLHILGRCTAGMDVYRWYFRLLIPILSGALLVVYRLERLDSVTPQPSPQTPAPSSASEEIQ